MLKATFTLQDGTSVTIEGSSAEVKKILDHYSKEKKGGQKNETDNASTLQEQLEDQRSQPPSTESPDLAAIIRNIKECPESDLIESQILDRPNLASRVLLPLYVVHQHMENKLGLTSGEISKITADLGVPISQPNVSNALSRKVKRFVVGDKVRKKGQPVRYRISHPGVKHMKEVLSAKESAN